MDMEYTEEIYGPSFDIHFISGDEFINEKKVAVSIKEVIFEVLEYSIREEIVKIICKNKTNLICAKDEGVKNVFVNLALFPIQLQKDHLFAIRLDSTPMEVSITQGKLSFEFRYLNNNKEIDWTKIKRAFVRVGLTKKK